MNHPINVVKNSGDVVPVDVNNLVNSLRRSNAREVLIQQIVVKVENQLYDGLTTKKIYEMDSRMIEPKARVSATKYKLKKALMELGPSGLPFEKLVGKLLVHEGFSAKVGVIVKGYCVEHEVDVIAQKDNTDYMIECKYHNAKGRVCIVKISISINY